MKEKPPMAVGAAAAAVCRCVLTSANLGARGRLHFPRQHVGERLRFADSTEATVYRETVVDRAPTRDPVVLVVQFRLRWVRGRGHAWFRAESWLNTPLFVGFPGFVSKLWLTHDSLGRYRGVYEWGGAERAESYARALWQVLALVSVRGSIHYQVLPGLHRDQVLSAPELMRGHHLAEWSRLVRTTSAVTAATPAGSAGVSGSVGRPMDHWFAQRPSSASGAGDLTRGRAQGMTR